MDFSIPCACGRSLVVSKGLAGTTAACECGERLTVPSLKELRLSAGLAAVPISPEDEVATMLSHGELPGEKCLRCGHSTDLALEFVADCEGRVHRGIDPDGWLFAFLNASRFMLVARNESSRFQIMGRETVVPVVLAVCDSCQSRLPLHDGRVPAVAGLLLLVAAVPAFWFDSRVALTLIGFAVICQLLATHQRSVFQTTIRRMASVIDSYDRLFAKFPHAVISRPRGRR